MGLLTVSCFFLNTDKRAKSTWFGVLTELVVEVAQLNSS